MVFERRAGQAEAARRVQAMDQLRRRGVRILDRLRLVEDDEAQDRAAMVSWSRAIKG
jgi:hypothetical protein